MVLFCKYAPSTFPGVESLNNFYVALHDDSYPAESFPLSIRHPDNPPLFAWAELATFSFTGNRAHVKRLLKDKQYLQKHFAWFDAVPRNWVFRSAHGPSAETRLKSVAGGYLWDGCASGMDNTPRKADSLWVDAISQQALSALHISRLADRMGFEALSATWQATYAQLKQTINQLYWHEDDGIYYDVDPETLKHVKRKTPASFWPMLAEVCSQKQAARMVQHIQSPDTFGGPRPWTTLARSDPDFSLPDGNYWQGAIWLPTAYMGTKALETYGYHQEADDAAEALLAHMLQTYREYQPQTIWECYSPTRNAPANHKDQTVRPDFCGWSALGPISMFIENLLGFHSVDALQGRVIWRLHQPGRHGIRGLRFGTTVTDLIYDGHGSIHVHSNHPYTLIINGTSHSINNGDTFIAFRT